MHLLDRAGALRAALVMHGLVLPGLFLQSLFLQGLAMAEPPLATPFHKPRYSFHVMSNDAGGSVPMGSVATGPAAAGWVSILSSLGLSQTADQAADVVVVLNGAALNGASLNGVASSGGDAKAIRSLKTTSDGTHDGTQANWQKRVDEGSILILEGESPLAELFGFHPISNGGTGSKTLPVQSVEDLRVPELRIIWEKPLDLPVFEIPKDARVFAWERGQKAPLLAGYRRGGGAVLWVGASPGEHGYERFPYIPQALMDLGFEAPFRSERLWAFFDSAYRSRVDLDYFARRWRAAGIGALHVAAWHYWERDPQSDAYLKRLIEACHRNSIQVYAWFELPHVSEKFWDSHPQWREKTALLQDARLDWRKLVNLSNRAAFNAVSDGVNDLTTRFDWDGVNLAELYFESLEGVDNPARLTPMNDDVRTEFKHSAGFDPLELFDVNSPRHWSKNAVGLKQFLNFRAELAQRQQTEWITQIEAIRKSKPYLDLTLTHIDDRFDGTMRDKLGADTTRVLSMLGQNGSGQNGLGKHDFTLLIEDPATIWNLGPQRYPQIAARYAQLTPAQEKLAIDINIVERYQDVYPTKQQTGEELFQLVHTASNAFSRVAVYFENSISRVDLPLLSSAAATVERAQQSNGKLVIESRRGVGVPWNGPVRVDGKPWPFVGNITLGEEGNSMSVVWLPKGIHTIETANQEAANQIAPFRVLDFNGDLKSASVTDAGIEFAYENNARAMAVLDRIPARLEIDGAPVTPVLLGPVLLLPKGQHLVSIQ
jgi:hypothetical protein